MANGPGDVPTLDFVLRAFTEKAEQDITQSAERMGENVSKQSAKMQQDLQKTEDQFKATAAAAKLAADATAKAAAPRAVPIASAPIVTPASKTYDVYQPALDSNGRMMTTSVNSTGYKNQSGGSGLTYDDKSGTWLDASGKPIKNADPVTPPIPAATRDTDLASDGTRRTRMRLLGAGLTAAGAYGIRKTNQLLNDTQETRSATERMGAMLTKQGDAGSIDSMQALSSDLAQRSAMASTVAIKDAVSQLSGFGLEAQKIEEVLPGLIGYSRVYGKELGAISDAAADAFNTGDIKGLEDLGVKITDAQREAVAEAETQAEKQKAIYDILKGSFSSYSDSLTAGMTKTEINANRTALALNEMQSNMATGAERVDAFAKGIGVSLLEMVMPSKGVQETAGAVQSLGSYAVSTTGGVITLLGGIADAKDGMDALGISTKGIGPAVGIARTALGSLLPFFSIALPGAIAIGAALMFKAVADAANDALDNRLSGPDVGQNLGDANSKEGALRHAADLERRAKIVEENIKKHEEEKKISWPINLKTGQTPAQYQEQIEEMVKDRDGMVNRAAELRSKANTLPSSSPSVSSTPILSTGGSGETSYSNPATASSISLRPQIEAIQDRIRHSKSKREKEELREELIRLQRAERDRKAAESEAKRAANKAKRAEERAADYASSVASSNAESAGSLAMLRLDAKDKIAQNRAKIALDSQLKSIDKQKELGLIDDDAAENQIERLKHAYAVRNAAMEKDALMRKAQIEAQAELASAQAEASTQEAAQAKATLAKAKIKSDAILEKAKIEASVIGSDIAPLENKKSKSEMLLAHLQGGGSLASLNGKDRMGLGVGTYSGSGRTFFGGNSGSMVNPYAGANYGSGLDAFTRMINGGNVFDRSYSTSPADAWKRRGKNVSHTAKIDGNDFEYIEQPDGSFLLKLVTEIPLPQDKFIEALGMIG